MPRSIPPVVAAGALSGRPQPVIEGDGLTLRPWAADDAGLLVEAFRDPAIRQWHRRSIDTADEAEAWIAESGARWREDRGANWVVVDRASRADGVAVGRVGLTRIDLTDGFGELSYWVLPDERGRRIAVRATNAVTAWAFDELGLHRIELHHSTANEPSCRVARAAGFAAEGTARSMLLHDDGWHDVHLHARLATDDR